VAEEVVGALRLELTPAERARARRRNTEHAEAYDLYMRGRTSFVNLTAASLDAAMADFKRALALDPDYAQARAGLAIAAAWYSTRFAYEADSKHWGALAEEHAKLALDTDPSLAEATLAVASAAGTLHGGFDWHAVLVDASRALTMDPSLWLAHVVRMRAFYHLGLFEQMDEEHNAARVLNPAGSAESARLEVAGSLFRGTYDRARQQAVVLLPRSNAPVVPNYLGLAQFYLGDVAAARATLAAVKRPSGEPDTRSQAALAAVEAAVGERDAARARALEIERGPYMDHHVAYSLGNTWAQLGDVPATVKWLRHAADNGWPCYPWVLQDPLLDPVRRAPEFTALLDHLRQRHEADKKKYAQR
jgi:tetratricopeptide (TPR) repeat protein